MRVKVISVCIIQEDAGYSVKTQLPQKMSNGLAVTILEQALRDLKAKEIADNKEERQK